MRLKGERTYQCVCGLHMYVYAHTRTLSCAFLSTSLFLIIYLIAYTKCLRRVPCFTYLFIVYCTCLYLIRAHSYVIDLCVYKPLYTLKCHNNLYCTSLMSSVCMFAANMQFLEVPLTHVIRRWELSYLQRDQKFSKPKDIARSISSSLSYLSFQLESEATNRKFQIFANKFTFMTKILEKLPSSLCLNPRVCELLTCPSSCDGSRQSGGCVDVAWECVADEKTTTDERKKTHR